MADSFSSPLEHADALVVGDAAVELLLLPLAGVEVVADDVVAEGGAKDLRLVEQDQGVAQRLRDLPDVLALIGIALEGGLEFELVFDAVEAAGQRGGEGEIGVHVRAGYPTFRAHA